MIGLITATSGNLQNIKNMLDRIDVKYHEIIDADIPENVTTVILPGVGAFPAVMAKLTACGLDKVLRQRAGKDFDLIGVCSGMQVLADKGFEGEETPGLGLIPGTIVQLAPIDKDQDFRIPHVGWAMAESAQSWFSGHKYFYFTHSFHFQAADASDVAAWTEPENINKFAAIVRRGRITGIQFHPEVSGEAGQELIVQLLQS